MEALWVLVVAAFDVWPVPCAAIVMPSLSSIAVTEMSGLQTNCSFKVPQSLKTAGTYSVFESVYKLLLLFDYMPFLHKNLPFIFLISYGCNLQ